MTQRTICLILCALALFGFAIFGPYSCSESQPQQAYRLDFQRARPRVIHIVKEKSPEEKQDLNKGTIERETVARAIREEAAMSSTRFNRNGSIPVEPEPSRKRFKRETTRDVSSEPSFENLKAVAEAIEGDSADLGNAMKDLNNISKDAVGLMRLLLNPSFLQNSNKPGIKRPRD